MSSKSFITFILSILAVTVIAAVITGFYVVDNYEEPTVEILSPQKTMEHLDTYDIVTPSYFGKLTMHSTMHVIHDNNRNVTCWLYDDGISCIPDRYLEEVDK